MTDASSASDAPTFPGGLLIGIANPKAWVAIAAVFASTRLADGAAIDAIAKVAVLSAMIVAICSTWLLVVAFLAQALRDPRLSRIVNVALAVALVVSTAPRDPPLRLRARAGCHRGAFREVFGPWKPLRSNTPRRSTA
jgi:threonine/homoserine/homoserine lactone efflux protein